MATNCHKCEIGGIGRIVLTGWDNRAIKGNIKRVLGSLIWVGAIKLNRDGVWAPTTIATSLASDRDHSLRWSNGPSIGTDEHKSWGKVDGVQDTVRSDIDGVRGDGGDGKGIVGGDNSAVKGNGERVLSICCSMEDDLAGSCATRSWGSADQRKAGCEGEDARELHVWRKCGVW